MCESSRSIRPLAPGHANVHGPHDIPIELAEWEAFYLITGPSGAVLLLVIGLHNAWDIALFTATCRARPEPKVSDAAVQMPADSGPPLVT